MITITPAAHSYLNDLLNQQEMQGMVLRVTVSFPGTASAELALSFCTPGGNQTDDIESDHNDLKLFIDANSAPFLQDASMDYIQTPTGGRLTLDAPRIRVPQLHADSPLSDRINYILHGEINPQLAAHGGQVNLVDITEDGTAVLQFGGGCQGCGMIDATFKQGIEKTLLERLPELKTVVDATDHSQGNNAYFK